MEEKGNRGGINALMGAGEAKSSLVLDVLPHAAPQLSIRHSILNLELSGSFACRCTARRARMKWSLLAVKAEPNCPAIRRKCLSILKSAFGTREEWSTGLRRSERLFLLVLLVLGSRCASLLGEVNAYLGAIPPALQWVVPEFHEIWFVRPFTAGNLPCVGVQDRSWRTWGLLAR